MEKLAKDPDLSKELRKAFQHSNQISVELRKMRTGALSLTKKARMVAPFPEALASFPSVTIFDCKHLQTLPGIPLSNPVQSGDSSALRAFKKTTAVANFFQKVFGRNSIDGAGMTMMSSIHFGVNHNNAIWNGSQMIYGDGDNQIFIDFTNGSDVISHELTHGFTQHTLQLGYTGEAGGLNESISDCFGAMFRQWEANQDINHTDWLIGHDILGPVARAKDYTCLRNMANPSDPHCIAPQPMKYSQITPNMKPHYSSGPPNHAFYLACKLVGGKSWEKVGKIWYLAITDGANPRMKMKEFADRTRNLASQNDTAIPGVAVAVDKAWKHVEL
ncbi:MAG: M4 family metallopeptidase [Pseudomonadota bacterium]